MKKDNRIYFAGQNTGTKDYVKFTLSVFVAGINCCSEQKNIFDNKTVIGALAEYIFAPNDEF